MSELFECKVTPVEIEWKKAFRLMIDERASDWLFGKGFPRKTEDFDDALLGYSSITLLVPMRSISKQTKHSN